MSREPVGVSVKLLALAGSFSMAIFYGASALAVRALACGAAVLGLLLWVIVIFGGGGAFLGWVSGQSVFLQVVLAVVALCLVIPVLLYVTILCVAPTVLAWESAKNLGASAKSEAESVVKIIAAIRGG